MWWCLGKKVFCRQNLFFMICVYQCWVVVSKYFTLVWNVMSYTSTRRLSLEFALKFMWCLKAVYWLITLPWASRSFFLPKKQLQASSFSQNVEKGLLFMRHIRLLAKIYQRHSPFCVFLQITLNFFLYYSNLTIQSSIKPRKHNKKGQYNRFFLYLILR